MLPGGPVFGVHLKLVWGRKSDPVSRRGFLGRLGLVSMSAAVGGEIVFADQMPSGLIPAALAQSPQPFQFTGKEGLSVMNDRPLVAETPAHLLDDAITLVGKMTGHGWHG